MLKQAQIILRILKQAQIIYYELKFNDNKVANYCTRKELEGIELTATFY